MAATDVVCLEHLDVEYAGLCRRVVGKLGRKRPSPLTRGDLGIWAAGVVYAVGQLNFVIDPAQTPHATADQLSGWLGVKKTTMANKARLVRDTLQLSHFDSEFMRRDLVEASPLTWLREVDGLLVDMRHAPVHFQVRALELGLIPTSPGLPMTGRDEVGRLLEVITVDCYNPSEQMTAFYEVFAEEVPLRTTATVVGATVRVVGIDIAEHREELTARCQRGEVVQELRLSDLVFPPHTAAAWIHAAYRRCLGLRAHPTAMPAGWKPSWL